MHPSMMPTRIFEAVDRSDWADRLAIGVIGSTFLGSDVDRSMRKDIAALLRSEREESVKLLLSMASTQLDERTAKVVERCSNAIKNR